MQSLQELFTSEIPQWLIHICLTLLIVLVLDFFVRLFFRQFVAEATSRWNRALIKECSKPARVFVWVLALNWILDILWEASKIPLLTVLSRYIDIALIAVVGWALFRMIRRTERIFLEPTGRTKKIYDPTSVIAIGRLVRIVVILIVSLIVFQSLGYSMSGILAFGGVGGLAIGFAAKDMLANFFGGLMIYLDKPFRVGDWIRSPDKKIEGTVEYIGWRQTRIRTFDKRPLYVPNATFANISVENASRMQNRRIKETIGLRYCDGAKVATILAEIKQYLENNNDIAKDKILMVNFNQFGSSSLDCFIYCFTCTTDWVEYQRIKQEVLLEVMSIVHNHDADIAFPTTTLDIPHQFTAPVAG